MSNKTVTSEDLLELMASYDLSPPAEEYVRETLLTEPSREVGQNARKNVSGAFCSPSQGTTIQYESHTAELAWLLRWELDPDVVGFRDQPPMVQLRKADKNGVLKNSMYTPDYLLFHCKNVYVIEVKTDQNLIGLSEKYPDQWQYINDEWHYTPAEEAFSSKGLVHKVCSIDTTLSIETNNCKTLLQVQRMTGAVLPRIKAKLLDVMDSNAWLSLSALQSLVPDSSFADIYCLILERELFVNLRTQLLTDAESCFVSSDPALLSVSEKCLWQAPDVVDSVETSLVPGKVEMRKALERLERVNSNDQSRHARRLRQRVREGKALGKTPLQALVMTKPGNGTHKLPEIVRKCVREHIRSEYMVPARPSMHAAWTDYRNWSKQKQQGISPVSLKTYRKYVELENSEEVAYARGGKRAGNAASRPTSVLDRALVATRPFERCSIDHSKLKILAKISESGGKDYSKKPWLSALIDDSSGYWLSFFLSFRDPSKCSLSMLFRNCVREHGLLPELVHSDRGADLRSVYYRGLLAHYGITADWNPSGHSRFNSLVERLNKQIKDQWISRRAGNTVDYRETRKYSKGYRPQDQATLSISDLFDEIEAYRHLYNQTVVGSQSAPPDQQFRSGLETFDFSGIPVVVDDEFLLVSAYDTKKEDYQIGAAGEVVFNGLHYFHPELRRVRPKRNRTELRIDPEDPYRVYCKVDDNWVTALHSGYKKFVAKNSHARWAEALQVAEGRPLRDIAKQDAHDVKALTMDMFDDGYQKVLEKEDATAPTANDQHNSPEIIEPDNPFERLRRKSTKELGATPR